MCVCVSLPELKPSHWDKPIRQWKWVTSQSAIENCFSKNIKDKFWTKDKLLWKRCIILCLTVQGHLESGLCCRFYIMISNHRRAELLPAFKPVRNLRHMIPFSQLKHCIGGCFSADRCAHAWTVKDKQRRLLKRWFNNLSLWLDQSIACRGTTSSSTQLKPLPPADGGDTVPQGATSN